MTARMRQQVIYDLLVWLPRLGLINETCELLETARLMERDVSVGPGAVTEFDELFAAGYRSLVETLVQANVAPGDHGGHPFSSPFWILSSNPF